MAEGGGKEKKFSKERVNPARKKKRSAKRGRRVGFRAQGIRKKGGPGITKTFATGKRGGSFEKKKRKSKGG